MIPDDEVDRVRAAADIVDVVGEVVKLKRSGKEWKGNCPFHEEKTPSFYVNPGKGVYNCFGCGAKGDVFSFVQERLGLEFVEAVKHVAGRAGVTVREIRSGPSHEEDPLRPLYEANAFAQKFFQDQLRDSEQGRQARAYLADRGIDDETVERFGLGWAPDDWRTLIEAADHHGISVRLLTEAGLTNQSEKSPEPYDRFRARVTFPIEALGGRVIGFSGRIILDDTHGAPKYLNTPETPVYHKSDHLYGLNAARHSIRQEEVVLLVEGQMDVVSLAAAGFPNAVAPLGTALTEAQARLVRRYAPRALLLYDSDRAGLKATFRSGDILVAAGVETMVVSLPDGEDPDTLVRTQGPDALRRHMDGAVDILERKLQILEERDYFSTLDRKRNAVDRLLPTLRAVSDPIRRDMYLQRVAEKTGVQVETLTRELAQSAPALSGPPRERPRRSAPSVSRSTGAPVALGPGRTLLRVLARDRKRRQLLIERALERIGPEDFKDPTYRAIFQAFMDEPELETPPESMEPSVARRLEELLAEPPDRDQLAHAEREFLAAVARMEAARLSAELDELQRQIEATTDGEEQMRLVLLKKEKRQLLDDARHAGGAGGGEFARRLARRIYHRD